jgi:hypothetical protein
VQTLSIYRETQKRRLKFFEKALDTTQWIIHLLRLIQQKLSYSEIRCEIKIDIGIMLGLGFSKFSVMVVTFGGGSGTAGWRSEI